MGWLPLASVALGGIVGAGSTMLSDRLKWLRDREAQRGQLDQDLQDHDRAADDSCTASTWQHWRAFAMDSEKSRMRQPCRTKSGLYAYVMCFMIRMRTNSDFRFSWPPLPH
jgi:hypothetical protein